MSFATEIKNEITYLELSLSENISFLSAILRNSDINEKNRICFITENPKVAKKVYLLLKEIYNVNPIIEQGKGNNFNKKSFYNVICTEKANFILKDLRVLGDNNKYLKEVPKYLIDSEDLIRAYLRGAFLATGSVNDPKTSRYHLEFLMDYKTEALMVSKLLKEFDINSKIITRDKGYMLYIKEAEKIGDLLRIMSANKAVLYYEDIRIYRDHKNMTNRLNNCEQANMDKTISASEKQLEDINIILDEIGIDLIDEKIKDVIIYRKKYPESSLEELSEIISLETNKPITKSGINHRIRKIKELANKIRENKKDQ